jgi:hypothetical protein
VATKQKKKNGWKEPSNKSYQNEMKKAYKQQYSFAIGEDAEKYEIFLKQQILQLNPNFYGVANKKKVHTTDGLMFAVDLTTVIEDPTLESVAECWINNQLIYLWRDRCWTIAVGKDKKQLLYRMHRRGIDAAMLARAAASSADWSINNTDWADKSLLIYPIGTDPI